MSTHTKGHFLWVLLLVLLLLSRFSRVRLCVTPQTEARQAPPSLGFSRQEHWSGLPFPFPMHERKSESEVTQSWPTLNDPMDCSLPGSSAHGIFQARVLEWLAIAFSKIDPQSLLFFLSGRKILLEHLIVKGSFMSSLLSTMLSDSKNEVKHSSRCPIYHLNTSNLQVVFKLEC